MYKELFQINYNPTSQRPNTAALILCLKSKSENIELFKSWFAKELPAGSDLIVAERVECALRCRKILNSYFGTDESLERGKCVKYLSRLILAKYSGKSQSYLSKMVKDQGSIDLTLDRIAYAIKNKQPLIFLFCFGGYKNHNCVTFPEVDWAEFFQLKFFIEYLLPIINDYQYGSLIQYESEDIIIERNNVPTSALDMYAESFAKLIDFVKKLVKRQHNIDLNIELVRCRNQYDINELFSLMETKRKEITLVYDSLSESEKEKWLKRAETNYMWEGGTKTYPQLTETEKKRIIYNARIDNECFLAADYDLRGVSFFDRPNCIPFVGTWGYSPSASIIDLWFHLKSTSSSSVDFWIGTGVLSCLNDLYKERIISPPQYKLIESSLKDEALNSEELLNISKNFSSIKVYHGKFPF